MEHYEESSF